MLFRSVATVRADTSNTQGSCSAAILYILGIISKRPCEAVTEHMDTIERYMEEMQKKS